MRTPVAPILAVLLTLVLAPAVSAQEGGPPFLRIPLNAHFAALGDTYTAYSTGAAAMVGNPAGLAAGVREASLTYQRWIASTGIYNGTGRLSFGSRSGAGISVTMFDATGDEAEGAPSSVEFSEGMQYLALAAGVAHQVGMLRFGVTGKYIAERVFDDNASGAAIDAGVQAALVDEDALLGLSIHNVGSMSSRGTVETDLPLMVRVGAAAYPLRIYSGEEAEPTFRFMIAPELVIYPNDDANRLHLGVGAEISGLLSLRAGFLSGDELRTFTGGAGVLYGSLQFDYAFLPLAEGFDGPSHMLTLTYGW